MPCVTFIRLFSPTMELRGVVASGWSIGLVTRRSWVQIPSIAKLSLYSFVVKLYAPTHTPGQLSLPSLRGR